MLFSLFTRARDFRLSRFAERAPAWARPALASGTSALMAAHVLRTAIRLANNLILTRILAPDAFGAIGIISSIGYILNMLLDMGFGEYLVRHNRNDAAFLSVIWTVRIARGVLLAGLMVFFSGPLAAAFGNPELQLAVAAAALLFAIDGFSSLSFFMAARDSRVARLSLLELAELVSQCAVAIVAALFLRNYWAIFIGMIWAGGFRLFSSYVLLPRLDLRIRMDAAVLADLWRFARVAMPAAVIAVAVSQADKIFMARYFPLDEVGVFMLASTLILSATHVVDQYSERIFFPRAAQFHRSGAGDGRAVLYASKRRLFLLFAFGFGALMTGAELVTRILFDDRYLGAAPYLAVLAAAPFLRLITAPASFMLIAGGQIRVKLVGYLLRLAYLAIAAPLALQAFGPIGVVAAASTVELPVVLYCWQALGRLGMLRIGQDLLLAAAACGGAAAGYAANEAARALVETGLVPPF